MGLEIINPPPTKITRARIIRTTNLGTGGLSVINWQAEAFDNQNIWNIVQPSRLTIPTAGIWIVLLGLLTQAPAATATFTGQIRKNGVTPIGEFTFSVAAGVTPAMTVSVMDQLSRGDYLEALFAYDPGFVLVADGGHRTFFAATLIGT